MATILIAGVIVILVVFAAIKISKKKAKGNCSLCPYAGTCSKDSCPEE